MRKVPRKFFLLPLVLIALGGLVPADAAEHSVKRSAAACGTSNDAYLANAPAVNLCKTGTASAVSGKGPWSWSCSTGSEATSAQCSAKLLVPGACGRASAVTEVSMPKYALCASGLASSVSGKGPWTWTCTGNNESITGCTTKSSTAAPPPVVTTAPSAAAAVYGVTLDDVSNVSGELFAPQQMAHRPTTRIVFDTGEPASYYLVPLQTLHTASYIMGELVDSSYMTSYTAASVQAWTTSYTQALGAAVDIWEVGNEVNGNWLSTESDGADVMPKIEAMYDVVAARGAATAITFFYEGEPSESANCIASDHGGNDMFSWISTRFSLNLPVVQRPAETEKIRLNLDYALISWYPDQCPGENPNWAQVYTKLAAIFPKAKVGFGELGTANPSNGSSAEINEIDQYYPMAHTISGLPASYIGGYFWWYFAEEMVPWPGTLGTLLNTAIR